MCFHVIPLRGVLSRSSLAGRFLLRRTRLRLLLGLLSSRWNHEFAVDLALGIESQADLTATQQALEQQVGDAVDIRYEVWGAIELMMAAPRIRLHGAILVHFTWPLQVSPPHQRAFWAARIRAMSAADILRLLPLWLPLMLVPQKRALSPALKH